MASSGNGGPRTYAVRLAEAAGYEIQDERQRLTGISGPEVGDDWRGGVMEAIRSLATYPERCIVAAEDSFSLTASCVSCYTAASAARLGASSSLCMKPTRATRPRFGCIMSDTARARR